MYSVPVRNSHKHVLCSRYTYITSNWHDMSKSRSKLDHTTLYEVVSTRSHGGTGKINGSVETGCAPRRMNHPQNSLLTANDRRHAGTAEVVSPIASLTNFEAPGATFMPALEILRILSCGMVKGQNLGYILDDATAMTSRRPKCLEPVLAKF